MEANNFQSLNQAGDTLLKNIIEGSNSDENILISSLSIATAFSMLTEGLDTQSQAKLSQFFGFDTQEGISQASLQKIFKIFSVEKKETFLGKVSNIFSKKNKNEDNGAIFNLANSLWTNKNLGLAIKDNFKNQVQKKYKALLSEVNPNDGAAIINNWIEEQTNNKIKNCIDNLDGNFLMILVNAVYFKGSWAKKFDKKQTTSQDFYLTPESSKRVDFMKGKIKVGYLKQEAATYISMSYQGTSIKFVIGLPDNHGNFDSISLEAVDNVIKKQEIEVKLTIPKFKIEFKTQLQSILASNGLDFLFSPGEHFRNITDEKNAAINSIIHQTFLQVDEEGTEAAGATAIMMVKMCLPMIPEFVANRPFKFFIVDGDNGMIIFSGILQDPNF